jgi:predicted ATPase
VKIDIHTHTKKCKSGDPPTRAIPPASFCETVLATDVRIIAVTNHNVFDLDEYADINKRLKDDAQVWPGIELDILDNDARGHLLVIVSPTQAKSFSDEVNSLTTDSTPDTFAATVDRVLEKFDSLKPLYVAHYEQKKPNLPDAVLEKLLEGTRYPSHVIREVTNSISEGIYISHGHASIFGSDVHDWAKYEELSRELPDLRLPVDSFEHFCLLLEKDPTTINTVLNRKTSEDLTLIPFEDGAILRIPAFNDIKVVFGPKGTGKTCILRAIAKHYAEKGTDASLYVPASDRLDDIFDVRGKDLKINLNNYGLDYCSNEIKVLRSASEVAVTNVGKYQAYFTAKHTNRNAKKILLKDIEPEEELPAKRAFLECNEAVGKVGEILAYLSDSTLVRSELADDDHVQLTSILSQLLVRLKTREWAGFSTWKESCFLNSAISVFRREVERKTGFPAKPTTTGFRAYAINRIKIEVNVTKILNCVDTTIPVTEEPVGSLGSNKGGLVFRTEFVFQNGSVTDSSLTSLSGTKKGTQKKFVNCVRVIKEHTYANDLFQQIAQLNDVEDVEAVHTTHELLLFKRYFALDRVRYTPSSGEASMVMLQKELGTDKEVYILDEPERSLGHEYINDVIVPLIKERARAGKKIFISTHDANIAVRTLPYSSIYRCHGETGYSTHIGNPFSNSLVNLDDPDDCLDWKKVSMRTLEGGETAFGERGDIYGNP